MSHKLMQAVNQVRLTNVAIVRLKRCGQRFEVACYKNKVVNWRNKVETDIDEVLQIDQVFHNVSKGVLAKNNDLVKAFGTDNHEECCKIILQKGDLQVSDLERELMYENLFRDIATIVTNKCINPETKRPYPVGTIETAMKETIHYAIKPSKTAKQQALDVIRKLQKHIPLQRAEMLLRLIVAESDASKLLQKIKTLKLKVQKVELIDRTDSGRTVKIKVFTVLSQPGHFRELNDTAKSLLYGSVQVQDFSVQEQNEADVEDATTTASQPSRNFAKKGESNSEAADTNGSNDSDEEVTGQRKPNKKNKKKGRRRHQHQHQHDEDQAKCNQDDKTNSNKLMENKNPDNSLSDLLTGTSLDSDNKVEPKKKVENEKNESEGLKCGTCMVYFGNDRNLQRQHYKTDLHRMNLKLKSKSLPFLTQEDFDLMDITERESIIHDYR